MRMNPLIVSFYCPHFFEEGLELLLRRCRLPGAGDGDPERGPLGHVLWGKLVRYRRDIIEHDKFLHRKVIHHTPRDMKGLMGGRVGIVTYGVFNAMLANG